MEYDWNKIYATIYLTSAVVFGVVCVLGVLGNGVVIWAAGFRMRKTVSTVWYLNLAAADFLATVLLPLKITRSALHFHWPFGWFLCKVDAVVFVVNMYVSIFMLVLISADRCVCVARPLWARCSRYRSVRTASWVSVGAWLLAAALSSPYFVYSHTKTPASHLGEVWCLDPYASTVGGVTTNFLAGFVVPFAAIVSCYSVIVRRLRNRNRNANATRSRSQASQSGRSFRIMATVVAAFFLCWLPFHVIRLVKLANRLTEEPDDTLALVIRFGFPVTRSLALLNSCLNPLLYVVFSQSFTDVFRCRSILRVLEKAFAEVEPPHVTDDKTPKENQMIRSAPPGTTQDLKGEKGELISLDSMSVDLDSI